MSLGGATYNSFIYLDEKKKLEESEHFFKRLIDIEEKLRELNYETKEDIESYLTDNLKGWRNYLRISKKAEQFIIGRRTSKKMREQNLFKDYTIQEIIYELKKIKWIQLDDKRTIITEISKNREGYLNILILAFLQHSYKSAVF